MKNPVLVIAEAGVNHNGSITLAKQMVEVAAKAGADYVKFQTFTASRIVTSAAEKTNYQIQATGDSKSQLEMLRSLELTPDMHRELLKHCKTHNIKFLSTGFDIESIEELMLLGQDCIKIPSGEITNLPYLTHVGKLGKPIVMSTGMAEMREIADAINLLEQAGTKKSDITVLHCTSDYPTSMDDVNLRAMHHIQGTFGVNIGYSDHTLGIEVAVAAVAMGAKVIEKHFTLDRELPGPDQSTSLEPAELEFMVCSIRNIERALGDGNKRPTSSELMNRLAVRKSLVASQSIRSGEILSAQNITAKRPANGISPMRWNQVIGRCACRDFLEDELIEL